jgi:hypothetical protein
MLYLVTIPGRRKRIQQNADSPEEAIEIIYSSLTETLRNGALQSECSAEECPDPMSQFKRSQTDGI